MVTTQFTRARRLSIRLGAALGAALLLASTSAQAIDEDVYADCVLKNTKVTGSSREAVRAIDYACTTKATPKTCRGRKETVTPYGIDLRGAVEVGSLEHCEQECLKAGFFSRTFGACSTG